MKILSRIFLGIIGLIMISLVGAHFYLSPERLQAIIQPYLQNALNRPITFQNPQIHYSIEPSISLENLVIQDPPNFSSKSFIKAQKAQLSLSPFSLLAAKIGRLHLQNGTIHITANQKGERNIDDLISKMRVPINQLQLTNITLTDHNQKTATHTTSKIIAANLLARLGPQGIDLTGETTLQSFTTQTPNTTLNLPINHLTYQLTYTPKSQTLIVTNLTLTAGPIVTTLAGEIQWQPFAIDLHTQNKTLDIDHIKSYFTNLSLLSNDAKLSGQGQFELHIIGAWPPKIQSHLNATNLSLADPNRLKNPIINGEISLSSDAQTLRIRALNFRAGQTDATLSGVISHLYQRPHLSFALKANTIDLDGLWKQPQSHQAQWGFTSPAFANTGKKKSALISLLDRVDMDGSIHTDSLRIQNTWIHSFQTNTHAQNGSLQVKPIVGQMHNGALNASLSLVTHEQGANLEGALSLVNASAFPLLNQTGNWQVPLYGTLNATTQLTAALDTTLTYLPTTTNANGRITMPSGKLIQWDILQDNLKSVDQLGLLTADEVNLQDVLLQFQIQSNTLTLNGSHLTAADLPCHISGTGAFDGDLNYAIDIDLPPSRIQFGGFNLGALLGKRAIPVRVNITGTSRAPKITAGMQ